MWVRVVMDHHCYIASCLYTCSSASRRYNIHHPSSSLQQFFVQTILCFKDIILLLGQIQTYVTMRIIPNFFILYVWIFSSLESLRVLQSCWLSSIRNVNTTQLTTKTGELISEAAATTKQLEKSSQGILILGYTFTHNFPIWRLPIYFQRNCWFAVFSRPSDTRL